MKRIIRLTESDLIRIVRRVITENPNPNETESMKKLSSKIVDLFNTPSFWKPYKGTITTLGNDREGQAILAFSEWWTKNIEPYVSQTYKDQFAIIKNNIASKLEGGTSSDTYAWKIGDTNYTVDTDF